MRLSRCLALALCCLPLALRAQTTVFNDSFTGDSLDAATYPTVTATTTGWDVASSKSAPAPTDGSGLQFNMVSTSSGFVEAQALFTSTPVQLIPGTNVQLTATFVPTNVLVHASDVLSVGLFNSGGSAPVAGLISSGLSSSSTNFATGGVKGWQGYNGYIAFTAGTSKMATRAAQTSTNNTNQDLVIGAQSSTAGYGTPAGATIGSNTTAVTALTNGATYTLAYNLSLSASGTTLTATYSLYSGAGATGTPLASYTGTATGATLLATSFDSMAIGWRADASLVSDLNFSSLVVSTTSGPPTIITQPPASTTLTASNNLNLTAVVSGAASYQWQYSSDGGASYSNLSVSANPSAGTASLTIDNVQPANAGVYQLVATNLLGSVTSSPAVVIVSTAAIAPAITTEPAAAAGPQGGNASFLVAASGVPAPTYQWFLNGVALANGPQADGSVIVGATAATLTLQGLEPDENGASLTAVASNVAGTATSSPAILTVLAPLPTITTQTSPAGATVANGSGVSFTAAATGASSYQWLFNGSPVTGNPSAQTTTLTLGALTPLNQGTYALAAINAGGETISAPAILNVTAAAGAPVMPVIPDGDFNVTAYGAVGDGATDNTAAIQSAINAATAAGGGTVEIPAAAANYLSGPLTLGSSISLQVDAGATLQALPYGTYPDVGNAPAVFISFKNATNVQIVGGGTIDGSGSGWWSAFELSSSVSRPDLVKFSNCSDVLVAGVTLSNSPIEHLVPDGCTNVTIDGMAVATLASSPNTDGIDPSGTNILIENCSIADGDDNIAVKPENTLCSNLTITGCAFGAGHGLSVGGQTNAGLNGMTVTNCTFNGTLTGLRLKADATEGGPVQNVTYSNLTMTNVPSPIVFYSYYNQDGTPGATSGSNEITPAKVNSFNTTPPNSLGSTTIPTWQNITISNVTATGASQYSIIWGLPLANGLFNGVTLNNVNISGGAGFEIYNATNVQLTGNSSVGSLITDNSLAITGQPQNQAASVGGAATFSATVVGASGTAGTPPTYQWTLNGAALANGLQADGSMVAGATAPTLTLSNLKITDAGSYALTAANNLDGYSVAANSLSPNSLPVSVTTSTAALTVQPSAATVTLSNLNQTYSGTPEPPTVTTTPSGVAVALTYNGSSTAPTAAGSYAVVATITDPNYTGAGVTGTLTISPAAGTVTLGNLSQTYGGGIEDASATTNPAGLTVIWSYNGLPLAFAPSGDTLAAYTAAVGQILYVNVTGATGGTVIGSSPNFGINSDLGTAAVQAGVLTVGQAAVLEVTISADGSTFAIVGIAPSGFTNGPVGVGTYAVTGTIVDPDYSGTGTATLTITQAPATVTLSNTSQTYSGSPESVGVTTSPANLSASVTYNGSATPPTTAGSYAVVATVIDPNYTGSASGTLTIGQAAPVLSWSTPATIPFGTALGAAQLDAVSTVGGTFGYAPAAGTVLSTGANQALSATFTPTDAVDYTGGTVGTTISVVPAAATATLGNLSQAYTGTGRSVSVTTSPSGLATTVAYNGGSTLPVTAGSYAVVATVANPNYAGSATGTLVITKATPVLAWAAPAPIAYGTALSAAQLDAASSAAGTFAYAPAAGTVLKAGAQTLTATFTPADAIDYTGGTVSTTLTVKQGSATIVLSGLDQAYTGEPLVVTATTNPAGLTVSLTYNGSTTGPTYPGTYAVVATITDPNYTGTISGSMVIGTTGLVNQAPVLNGNAAFEGSIQMLSAQSVNMSGNAYISGDLLVPGTPTLQTSGNAKVAGTINAGGTATPTNYQVNLSGNAVLRYLVRQINPLPMPTVAAPPASKQNVTLNGNAPPTTLAAGNYGTVIVNGNTTLIVGVAGATTPSLYNIQNLTLNGNGTLEVVGPVTIVVGNSVTLNGNSGASAHPEWLVLAVASGGVTLNGGVTFDGNIIAPEGQVIVNGNSTLNGTVISNSLLLNGGAIVDPNL